MKFFTLLLLALLSQVAAAQTRVTDHVWKVDSTTVFQPAAIDDFSRIIGYWSGTGLDGSCEEVWLPPADSIMHGVFRLVVDDQLVFSEFMSILDDGEGFALKVKHFNPDFTGWEAPDKSVNFRYIRTEENKLYFSGITFAREENKLFIYLAFRQKDNSFKEEVFEFIRRTGF